MSRGKVRYDMGYGYGREWTVVDDNCERARGGREEERRSRSDGNLREKKRAPPSFQH